MLTKFKENSSTRQRPIQIEFIQIVPTRTKNKVCQMNKKLAYVSTILLATILVSSCSKYPKVEEQKSPEFEKVLSLFKDEMPTEELSNSMKARIDELDKKCKANDDESCMSLSYIYSSRHKPQRDLQKAVNIWFDQCQKDNYEACQQLAYAESYIQKKDLEKLQNPQEKADSILQKRCDSGEHIDSCYTLAKKNLFSDDRNLSVPAFEGVIKACKIGSPGACYELSNSIAPIMFYHMKEYDQNVQNHCGSLYYENVKKQCKLGNNNYCSLLLKYDYKGEQALEKKKQIMSKIHERCQKGELDSCNFEGQEFFAADFPNDQEIKSGLEILNKACDQSYVESCTFLSDLYQKGKKIEKNETLSLNYLKKACDIGNRGACADIAKYYSGDVERPADEPKVIYYTDLAAENGADYGYLANNLYGYEDNKSEQKIPFLKKGCLLDKDPLACHRLGDAYYRDGKGDKKNSKKVVALYEYACSIDNFDSCRRLAEIYSKGELVDQNYDKAFEYSKKICQKEPRGAVSEASEYFTNNYGSRAKDDKKANELFEIACNLETPNVEACRILGVNNEKGIGTDQDYDKANRLYSKACNAGKNSDGEACFNLGANYESGVGIDENIQKANEYYRKSCELDNYYGCLSLAYNRENGIGFEVNQTNKDISQDVFNQVCSTATYPHDGCGSMYDRFLKMDKKNSKGKAIRIVTALCETGTNNAACFQSGLEYSEGKNVKSDPEKSAYYYKKGCYADKNYDSASCTNYGYNLVNGIGVKKDLVKATEAYQRACSGKNPDPVGCGYMAANYMFGYLNTVNKTKAVEYATLGCKIDHGYSCGILSFNYMYGEGTKQDYKESLSYGEKGCNLNDATSCNLVGIAYDEGKGVKQDYEKAKEYYGKGCELGFQKACDKYARVNKILQGVR